jgi:hypothetical protein
LRTCGGRPWNANSGAGPARVTVIPCEAGTGAAVPFYLALVVLTVLAVLLVVRAVLVVLLLR